LNFNLGRYILGTFVASAAFFGFSNLEGFVDAMHHMSGKPTYRYSLRPLMTGVRDAASSLRVMQALTKIRSELEREVGWCSLTPGCPRVDLALFQSLSLKCERGKPFAWIRRHQAFALAPVKLQYN